MKTNRIVIAGGTGFLGQVLARHFSAKNCDVVILTRRIIDPDMVGRQVIWDGKTIGDWARELDHAAAVINLSGKSVNCRYHARNRKEILDSRVDSTRVI